MGARGKRDRRARGSPCSMRKASRHPTLSSMANSGCLLLSSPGMLPHSLQCPPAFLYLPEVRMNESDLVVVPPPPPPPPLSLFHPFLSFLSALFCPRRHVIVSRSLCVDTQSAPPPPPPTPLTFDPTFVVRIKMKRGAVPEEGVGV